MKNWMLFFAGFLATTSVLAQEPQTEPKKHVTKVLPASSAPVTQSEARAVFARAEYALRRALNLPAQRSEVSIHDGSSPVRRDQVVAEMARIYEVIRPKVKLTPHDAKFDPSVFRMSDQHQRANLTRFVRMGAIARVGPLATGPENSLTVPQFGDAVGFYMSRIAQITHLPSNKWTPELHEANP